MAPPSSTPSPTAGDPAARDPADYPATAALLLHGHGEEPEGLAPIAQQLREALRCLLHCPAAPEERLPSGGMARSWWPADRDGPHPEAVAGLAASLEHVADHQHVIIAGFSQGGAMAVAVADHLARQRRALGLRLVVVAGFLPGEVALTHLPPASNAHALVVLGDADEVVDPFHGELLARRLSRSGWTVTQWHHPSGHQWHETVTAEVLGWLRR